MHVKICYNWLLRTFVPRGMGYILFGEEKWLQYVAGGNITMSMNLKAGDVPETNEELEAIMAKLDAQAEKKRSKKAPVAPKPEQKVVKSIRTQSYTRQTGVIVTGYTTQELLDKADQLTRAYERGADIMIGGRVVVDGGVQVLKGFAPAIHQELNTFALVYEQYTITLPGDVWDSAKIAVSAPGIVEKHHGSLK